MSKPSAITTTGTIGTNALPACVHCGAITVRLDSTRRGCVKCNKTSNLVIDGNHWGMVK